MRLGETYESYVNYMALKGMSEKTINEHKRFLYGSLSHSIQDKELDDLRITDMAYVLEAGRIVMEGSSRELATNLEIQKAYLG